MHAAHAIREEENMNIENVCEKNVISVTEDQSIVEVAALMRDNSIGDVIVVDKQNGKMVPRGMLTDRDIVTGLVASRADQISNAKVRDIMSKQVFTCNINDDLHDVLMQMQQNGVMRVPVLDRDGSLTGIVTSNHIFNQLNSEFSLLAGISARHKESDQAARAAGQTGKSKAKGATSPQQTM
jgi:CBS domain-containing protein